jgi:5-methyltetrahydrofolate--homocysteine methyltransferase
VFPIGAGPEFGNHYLDAVRELRKLYPDAHLFGGHSNISFGLPQRKLVNDTFISLSILAGCDSVMLDPVMNAPERFEDFMYVVNALTGVDEFSMKYLKYIRAKTTAASR